MWLSVPALAPNSNVHYIEKKVLWCVYWVALGILYSSVGLGTGPHTFPLYLHGAAHCSSDPGGLRMRLGGGVSIWDIVSRVRLEASAWGAGTAIGELPRTLWPVQPGCPVPTPDDRAYQGFEEMQAQSAQDFATRAKLPLHKLIQKVGFLGILACASIDISLPELCEYGLDICKIIQILNPLFDLAGITCGHFPSPLLELFGAMLIGKAVIKMHIERMFAITTFSGHTVEQLVALVGRESWLSWLFEKVVVVMVFVCSVAQTPNTGSRRNTPGEKTE